MPPQPSKRWLKRVFVHSVAQQKSSLECVLLSNGYYSKDQVGQKRAYPPQQPCGVSALPSSPVVGALYLSLALLAFFGYLVAVPADL